PYLEPWRTRNGRWLSAVSSRPGIDATPRRASRSSGIAHGVGCVTGDGGAPRRATPPRCPAREGVRSPATAAIAGRKLLVPRRGVRERLDRHLRAEAAVEAVTPVDGRLARARRAGEVAGAVLRHHEAVERSAAPGRLEEADEDAGQRATLRVDERDGTGPAQVAGVRGHRVQVREHAERLERPAPPLAGTYAAVARAHAAVAERAQLHGRQLHRGEQRGLQGVRGPVRD